MQEEKVFYMEGNKGSDYVRLTKKSDDTLLLEIGHSSVVSYRHIVPVEFLTSVLTTIGLECTEVGGNIVKDTIDKYSNFDKGYKSKLKDAVSDYIQY